MAKDRKQRLRPLQQTAQLQTGGLPSITSYQPKAAPQGKSNEAQMANALAQLAPSLTNFLSTKFQSDKKAGVAKGRQEFFKDTTSERNKTRADIFAGTLDEDEFFVEGYQRSWLRNLGRSYGLGLTQTVDKLDKTSSDEQFNEVLDKYTQEFRSRNGINLYQDEFINEEFLPQQEQFKNVVQQAFSAQKLQFIREQRDASFSIEISNIFSDLDDKLSNIGVQNVGVNSLGDLLNNKEDLITNFNNLAGTKFTKDTPVSELYSAASQHLQIVLKDAGVEDFTAFNQDVSRYDEFIEDEDTRKFIKNVNALTELQGTQLKVNELVDNYIKQTGDPRKGNKLAAESIAEYAFKELDEDVVDLIDMIQTPGGSWGNTEEGMAIKRQMKERIENEVNEIETAKITKRNNAKKEKENRLTSAIGNLISGTNPFTGEKIDSGKDESGYFRDPKLRSLLGFTIKELQKTNPEKAFQLQGLLQKHTTVEQDYLRNIFELRLSTGDVAESEIPIIAKSLGYNANQISAFGKNNQDRQYRERVFKRGSTAKIALDKAMGLFGVSLNENEDIFSQLSTIFGNNQKLGDAKIQANKAIDFYADVDAYAKKERAKLVREKKGILSEEDLVGLDGQVRDYIQEKITKIEALKPENPIDVTVSDGIILKDPDDGEFKIDGPLQAQTLIGNFHKKIISKGIEKLEDIPWWKPGSLNAFEDIVFRLYSGLGGSPYGTQYKNLKESYKKAIELILTKYGAETVNDLSK